MSAPLRPVLVALVTIWALAAPAWADRVALVLGTSNYVNAGHLANAQNDASDIAAKLKSMGFNVFAGTDLDRAGTLTLLDAFSKALHPDDLALFYYAGHGVQIGAENYIVPVDAKPTDEVTLTAASIKLQTILRTMELRANRRIVILDACRNNPFVEKLAGRGIAADTARGLAKVEAGVGSYIAFSTQPENVTLDGAGRNSPFTTALLNHINDPDSDIHAVMRRVRAEVVAETRSMQVPWENSSLVDEVFMGSLTAPKPQPQGTPQPDISTLPQRDVNETQYSYVDGLDPNGDGFLALRSGTAGDAARLAKMPQGTLLEVLATQGLWLHVRLLNGQEGWAHSRWVACCTRQTAAQVAEKPAPPASCEQLWFARNTIWASYGYCFTTARGQAAFGTASCSRNQAQVQSAMTPQDRAEVDRIRAIESANGCP